MIDLTGLPFIDHHCHPYSPDKVRLDPDQLAREFYHGRGDMPNDHAPRAWGDSDELRFHLRNMGVVKTMVKQLSEVLGCPAELDAVAAERNRRTADDFAAYAKALYKDANIVGTVVDSGLAVDDPVLDLIPGRKLRLFQFEPPLRELIVKTESYPQLLREFQEKLERSVKEDGFIGVKVHLAEQVGFGAMPVREEKAKSAFPRAGTEDLDAYRTVYMAVLTETLHHCRELGVPAHFHSGFTGGVWDGPIHNADPFLLAPFLCQKQFVDTKIVLLHAGYPWTKQAGQMAHAFPHVWVDISQVTPWSSLRIVECYKDVMAWAPLSKVMIGSGGHGTPEIAWLAARTAKIALTEVLDDVVRLDLMTAGDAEATARMILHDNAARLYGIER